MNTMYKTKEIERERDNKRERAEKKKKISKLLKKKSKQINKIE